MRAGKFRQWDSPRPQSAEQYPVRFHSNSAHASGPVFTQTWRVFALFGRQAPTCFQCADTRTSRPTSFETQLVDQDSWNLDPYFRKGTSRTIRLIYVVYFVLTTVLLLSASVIRSHCIRLASLSHVLLPAHWWRSPRPLSRHTGSPGLEAGNSANN